MIPSDTQSESDGEGCEGGGHNGQDVDDSRSVDTLPSVNAIAMSITKARPGSTNSVGRLSHTLFPMSPEVDK